VVTKGRAFRRAQLAIKRVCDASMSLAVLVLGFPLLALIAALVKLSSQGPVFFVQERIGKDERAFRMIKFRTMAEAREGQQPASWSGADEARVTRVGRFLRDYGLDELPQVINILRGEMSIVGPRAPLPERAKGYSERQRQVFKMRPGLVSIAVYEGRRSIPMEQRIELHVQYVETWSLCLDLKILLRSVPVVLLRRGTQEAPN
jgi:lipopolysaccharide/colanic/teichoic acid biosynthesis glycosyltransferase